MQWGAGGDPGKGGGDTVKVTFRKVRLGSRVKEDSSDITFRPMLHFCI